MNKVKVNVEFSNIVDENLELYTLVAKIRYSIPDVLGFKKTKEIEWCPMKDVTLRDWIKHMGQTMTKPKMKSMVQGYIREDIMKRLQRKHEMGEHEVVNQVLNVLNQMKFDFNIDIEEAENIVANVSKVDFTEDKTKNFGKVQGDYFNLHSKTEPCTICQ